MSGPTARTGGVIGPPTALVAVADLDRAERRAIEAGDWPQLGAVLDQQRELWQQLAAAAHCPDARTALQHLYRVRRRNHALIAAQAEDLRRRLLSARQGQAGLAAYGDRAGSGI